LFSFDYKRIQATAEDVKEILLKEGMDPNDLVKISDNGIMEMYKEMLAEIQQK